MTAAASSNVEDLYRLSPVQQGMLFHTLSAPGTAPYFEQFVFRYDAGLDIERLEQAWRRVVERHPVLRTSFFWEEVEEPVQLVHRRVELPFERLDWRDLPAGERQARLAAFLEEDRRRGFALGQAPLMRLTAIRWDEEAWRIVWSYHHLLLDGWSTGLVLREAAAFYEAAAGGPERALQARRPFRDYIAWLRQQDLAAAEAYWRRAFEGLAGPTALGIDRAPGRPPSPDGRSAEAVLVIPEALTAALQSFARASRVTLYTVVEGAWALALGRFSGSRDLLFGTTVSGRPATLPGAEAMVGCFINTLPVRVRIPGEQQLTPWLQGLQAERLEMRRHEHSPLVEVRRWSGLPGGGNRPMFDAILVFENYALQPGEESRNWEGHQRTNFPLTLQVWPGREMRLQASYDDARFPAEGVARLLESVETLLAAFVADPGRRLSDLPALPAEEWERAVVAPNVARDSRARDSGASESGRSPDTGRCLHELVGEQAARSPEAEAVACGDLSLTYRELWERAGTLAQSLARMGIRPEETVGVFCERSLDLVPALLGTLRAGGAYVPLDPTYPDERLAFQIADSGARVLLAGAGLEERAANLGTEVLPLGRGFLETPGDGPRPGVDPANLAYLIYTSGSTGRPKGVAIAHRNAAALVGWARDAFPADDLAGVLAATSVGFDLSVFEIFVPLALGGKVILAPNALALERSDTGVTLLNTVPSAAAELARSGRIPPSVRTVNLAGEPLKGALVREIFASSAAGRILNLYGPSEATTYSTWARIERTAALGEPSIGRPIRGTRAYVLDSDLRPCPTGVPGELCLAGAGLARGYLGRPELTAARFVPEPFADRWGEPGARLYRTGDLARLREDGEIEFLGRLDHQVKIRGFRIELGEIEAELCRHPGVAEAVVAVFHEAGTPGDRRLAAYVVPSNGHAPDPAALREHLLRRLPEPMVPASWVALAALPLTPNGKIDRKALPHPGRPAGTADREPPRSELERTVAAIWQEVLGIEAVGVRDNFFDLGGHSLLMMQVQRRLQDRLGRKLSMVDLLSHSSVGALAGFLAAERGGEPASESAEAVETAAGARQEDGKARLRQMRQAGKAGRGDR